MSFFVLNDTFRFMDLPEVRPVKPTLQQDGGVVRSYSRAVRPPPPSPAPLAPRDAREKSSVEGAVGARSYDANGETSRGDAAGHSSGRERAEAMRTEDAEVRRHALFCRARAAH